MNSLPRDRQVLCRAPLLARPSARGRAEGGGWAWGAQSQGQRRSLAGGGTQDAGAGAPPASGRSLRTGRTGRGPVRQASWAAWPSLPSVLPALDPGHVLRSREARAPATHITSTRPLGDSPSLSLPYLLPRD